MPLKDMDAIGIANPPFDGDYCSLFKKYRVIPPGVSGLPPEPLPTGKKYPRIEPEELEVVSLPELGIGR